MFLSVFLAACVSAPADSPRAIELKDGDRIVWIGSTLVEREQRHGYWETALLAANADKRITFRNLGWSGDTVWGESRGRFDYANPDKCFHQLVDQTLALKPTIIFVSYGTNESFAGKEGLPKFEKGLEKLLDALKPGKARIVLFTPPPFEKSQSLPDPRAQNERLALYSKTITAVANRRGLPVADLFHNFQDIRSPGPFTQNGMHLTADGYKAFTPFFSNSLAQPGIVYGTEQLEPLRKAIIEKNQLFFHRWRPENETYLFGFRKHEQGKNAKEVAEFDPLVSKAEGEIAKLLKDLKK